MGILNKIFGDSQQKYLKGLTRIVERINSLEPTFEKLSDEDLKGKTEEFKKRLKNGQSFNDILPEAFALVREAAKRTLKQRHFDVQLVGGIVLHQGKIVEMKTGEGKTLAATLPAYLNALEGRGVHIVAVNDYLAERDTVWMGQIYYALGLSVGCIIHEEAYLYDPEYQVGNFQFPISNFPENPNDQNSKRDRIRDTLGGFKVVKSYLRPCFRKEAYAADITYGTNNEFGFDYLKDNMVYDLKEQVQRGHNFAIIDEIDSILIDEARTPLIISSPEEESTNKYYNFAKLMAKLKEKEDYEIDEKLKTATFTEEGQNKIVKALGYDPWAENDILTTHQLESALKAKTLFKRDRDYVVKDGQIIIVDEFTGRLMPGRRWSLGLHQAVEAKEGLEVQKESRTWATITFQNYFKMYKKLAGMTGTALTSAEEFDKVYNLEVVPIPTNKPMIRQDFPDRVYKTAKGKFRAVVEEIKKRHKNGQPILVGTVSIEKNEYLGKLLDLEGIPHQLLNAKNHEKEAEIIAQAGKLGAVTIATNMAGRGVDIILGGYPPISAKTQMSDVKNTEDELYQKWQEEHNKVVGLGGLHVIGTERHEARRIDNQLRGRAGRQGDPGSSQFFVSLEDDLMRIFAGERIKSLMEMFKIPEDQPIESGMVSKAIESAQEKVEGFNFDARKHLLEYDEIMNKHREVFYKKRREILEKFQITNSKSQANAIDQNSNNQTGLRDYVLEIIKKAGYTEEDYNKKEQEVGEENMRQLEKFVCLKVLDTLWIEHLENMEYLKDSVRLRAFGQQDPLVEYKNEGRKMFQRLLLDFEKIIAENILKAEIKLRQNFNLGRREKNLTPNNLKPNNLTPKQKVGRNDPCPCGAKYSDGRPIKYKNCHGR